MSKIYMLKDPSSQLPIGMFTDYETAMDLASRMFRTCSMTEYGSCIEEWEVDPLRGKLSEGIYPWAVRIDLTTEESEVDSLYRLFDKEEVTYHQGPIARVKVYAPNEEEAENKAMEMWTSYQETRENPVKALKVFSVRLNEEAEVEQVHLNVAYTDKEIEPEVKYFGKTVEVRVAANSVDEALEAARLQYDEWIDQQILQED